MQKLYHKGKVAGKRVHMIKVSSDGNGSPGLDGLPSGVRLKTILVGKSKAKIMPPDVHDIRVKNLLEIRGSERGAQKRLAAKLGMTESQLSQYIGKTRQKPIGSRMARNMEKRLKMARGWLDTTNHDITEEGAEYARRIQKLTPSRKAAIKAMLDSWN